MILPGSNLITERERTHGAIADNSETFARLVEAMDVDGFPRELRYCLMGILVKLARMSSGRGDYVGHWEDVRGYAELGEQICLGRAGELPPHSDDTAFIRPLGTVRTCGFCGVLIAGGPTRCRVCASKWGDLVEEQP